MNNPRFLHVAGFSGQAWAHWDYDPWEWATFDQIDWEPTRNTSWLILILGPIISLAIIALPWLLFKSVAPLVLLEVVLGPAIVLLTGLIVFMVSAATAAKEAKKRYEARHNPSAAHRVTFASSGIWEGGVSFLFRDGRWHLHSIKLTANPAVLHLKLLKRNADVRGTWSGLSQKIRILVPRGHEAEAEQLRQRYYAEVIAPWKRPLNAEPEPM